MIPTEPIGSIPAPPELVDATLARVPQNTLLTALAAAVLEGCG
jgi:hypothetical protein